MKADKLWERIINAFMEIESDGIRVDNITIPKKYLRILEERPVTPSCMRESDKVCGSNYIAFVERKQNKKFISGAKVKIGTPFIVSGVKTVHV